ncbi:MAG: hypothetical protein JWM11_6557 [Planctomycetaceae bacterium]|nr:hypothetical protein [Planctomycetaceae bacterium]
MPRLTRGRLTEWIHLNGPFDVDELQDVANSRWSRRTGWLCVGLASATGLCCFSFAVPRVSAEVADRRSADSDDDTVGRASVNSVSIEESIAPLIAPAIHKTSDGKADQRVKPVQDSSEEAVPAEPAPGLFRWRRTPRLPQDPFADKVATKPVSPAQAKPAMRPSPVLDQSPAAAMARHSKTGEADGAATDLSTNRAAIIARRNQEPLATRRRLLEQLEKSESTPEQTQSATPVVTPRSTKPVRDLEQGVELRNQKVDQTASKAPATDFDQAAAHSAATRPRTLAKPESDQNLRAMFERSEDADEPQASIDAGQTRQLPTTRSPQIRSDASRVIKQVAETDASSDSEIQSAELSTETPVQALKLRARKAKAQGRTAAARQLEQTADSIEKQQQALQPEPTPVSDPVVEDKAAEFEATNPDGSDSTSSERGGPSLLPQPTPTFDEPIVQSELSNQPLSRPAKPTASVAGRTRLKSKHLNEPRNAAIAVLQSGRTKTLGTSQKPQRESLRPIDETPSATGTYEPPSSASSSQISTSKHAAGRTRLHESNIINGHEPKIRQSNNSEPISQAETQRTEVSAPSLIPTRPYLPDPQALANRSIQLPAPEGWSAARKFPNRAVEAATTSGWNLPQAQSPTAVQPPFEATSFNPKLTTDRPVELSAIEDVAVETPPAELQVLNGYQPHGDGLRNAIHTAESSAHEPARIVESGLDSQLPDEIQEQSWQPSWFVVICTAVCTLAGTLYYTRGRS